MTTPTIIATIAILAMTTSKLLGNSYTNLILKIVMPTIIVFVVSNPRVGITTTMKFIAITTTSQRQAKKRRKNRHKQTFIITLPK